MRHAGISNEIHVQPYGDELYAVAGHCVSKHKFGGIQHHDEIGLDFHLINNTHAAIIGHEQWHSAEVFMRRVMHGS